MLLSRYFLPTLKENPADAQVVSHRLMIRSGMIRSVAAGIYTWLPLGYRVLQKIEAIIHEEMQKSGAIPLLMPTLQPASFWQESGRYEAYGEEMLRITDRHGHPLLYGPTNEEVITDIFRHTIQSYKQLPLNLYHIQWKFRDEIRPRFGVMRGREFLMKDAYSFDATQEEAERAYHTMYATYLRIFTRMGLTVIPVSANTGPIGGKLSHEFHVLAETGESMVYYDEAFETLSPTEAQDVSYLQSLYAAADEKHDAAALPAKCLRTKRGIEVGHIFYFGTKYSAAMNTTIHTPESTNTHPHMGSYGIGVSRLVGALIEAFHDDKGIIWPESVAPFKVGILHLKPGDATCDALVEECVAVCKTKGIEVLVDDTPSNPGEKFATMDLIGLPHQLVIGPRLASEQKIEYKQRRTGERINYTKEDCIGWLSSL